MAGYPDKSTDELRPLLFTTLRNLTLNYLKSGNTKRQKASVDLLGRDDRLGCSRMSVRIDDPDLGAEHVSGSFHVGEEEEFVGSLAMMFSLEAEWVGNEIVLSRGSGAD